MGEADATRQEGSVQNQIASPQNRAEQMDSHWCFMEKATKQKTDKLKKSILFFSETGRIYCHNDQILKKLVQQDFS